MDSNYLLSIFIDSILQSVSLVQVIKTQPDVRLRKAASKNGSALVQPEIGYFLGLVCADRM